MTDINKIKAFFQKDTFAANIGIEIQSASPGESICRLAIHEGHFNAGKTVQGGVIFTLADFAFAVAANAKGRHTVSLNINISFMQQPKGRFLITRAKEIKSNRKVCFYDVSVTDELNTCIAQAVVNGYIKETEFDFALD